MKKNQIKVIHIGYGRFVNVIVMMTAPKKVTEKRALAVLNMDKLGTFGDFDKKMKLIRQDMKLNAATFVAPYVSVADNGAFATDIAALEAAETTALTKVTGASTARDVAKAVVLNDAHLLQGYVQGLADGLKNTQKAVALIQLSGFDVNLREPHSKDDFSAKSTKISGQVKLAINVKKLCMGEKRFSVKWQSSPDDGVTVTELPTTIKGSALVSNLTAGKYLWFRHLVVLKDGEHGWSDWVKVLVN